MSTYYIATARVTKPAPELSLNGCHLVSPATCPEHIFTVAPGPVLIEEKRTAAEIERAAVSKGHELSYCSLYTGSIQRIYGDKIRTAIIAWMRERYNFRSDFDAEVDVTHRIRVEEAVPSVAALFRGRA